MKRGELITECQLYEEVVWLQVSGHVRVVREMEWKKYFYPKNLMFGGLL